MALYLSRAAFVLQHNGDRKGNLSNNCFHQVKNHYETRGKRRIVKDFLSLWVEISFVVNKRNSLDYLFAAFHIYVKSLKVKRLNKQNNNSSNKREKRKENL